MTTPPQDDNLYAPPATPLVDHEPPTLLSRFSRVCIYSAVCVAAVVVTLGFTALDIPPQWLVWLTVLACGVLPTGWLLRTRAQWAAGSRALAPRRLVLLAMAASACTLALATVLTWIGSACIMLVMAVAETP